jgi:hypothetical protein
MSGHYRELERRTSSPCCAPGHRTPFAKRRPPTEFHFSIDHASCRHQPPSRNEHATPSTQAAPWAHSRRRRCSQRESRCGDRLAVEAGDRPRGPEPGGAFAAGADTLGSAAAEAEVEAGVPVGRRAGFPAPAPRQPAALSAGRRRADAGDRERPSSSCASASASAASPPVKQSGSCRRPASSPVGNVPAPSSSPGPTRPAIPTTRLRCGTCSSTP